MIDNLIQLSFLIMLVGLLSAIYHSLSQKQERFRKRLLHALLIVVIPFYVFYYILRLPDTRFKKIVAIACIGCFWVFFFLSILKIVFTPPV